MSNDVPTPTPTPPSRIGLATACALLTLAVAAVFPLVGYFAAQRFGADGWLTAGIAAGVCWFGSIIALILSGMWRDPRAAINGVLLGMLFRMGFPLVVGLALSQTNQTLSDAGIFGLILIFYFVTLVVETSLSLCLVRHAPAGSKGA